MASESRKVLAAYRAGVKNVVLPRLNEPDLDDVPEEAKRSLRFIPVDAADEALRAALPDRAGEQMPEAGEPGERRPALQ